MCTKQLSISWSQLKWLSILCKMCIIHKKNTFHDEHKHSLNEKEGRRTISLSGCNICNNTKIFMIPMMIYISCKINHLIYYTQCWWFWKITNMWNIYNTYYFFTKKKKIVKIIKIQKPYLNMKLEIMMYTMLNLKFYEKVNRDSIIPL